MIGIRAAAALSILAILGIVEPAAQSGQPQRGGQTFTATATAILVDVVVRDRNGRPLTNLEASDFTLAEDGVPHHIDSFTKVSRGNGIGVSVALKSPSTTVVTPTVTASDAATAEPILGDGATAIVFDQLSSESLRLAQRATLDYVPMNGESSVSVGVFATDPGVRQLQGFTTDRTLIRRAVAQVLPATSSTGEQKAERADELIARRRQLNGQDDPTAGGASGSTATMAQNASAIGQREQEMRMIQAELNMIRSSERLDREHRGYDTVVALLSVVRSLTSYPGRKTIVFFSEGLPASPALSSRLDTIIDVANRANVTAYAIDANGLRTKSTSTNLKKEMDVFAEQRFRQLETGADRSDQPLTMEFERVEDTLKLDSRSGLAKIAGETGGFLVEQSNDLKSAFRRIDEDSQFHYLLTYSPVNSAFDGRFRTIQVKVRRPGAQIFARKGYRALRKVPTVDTTAYDARAVALLDRAPLPNAFQIQAASLSFPDPARAGLTTVLVRVATDRLRFAIDARRGTYSGEATVVVRARDEAGREVQKFSQQYLLSGDSKDVEAAKKGEILFYREFDLQPGLYTMESIVFDAVADAGSARLATVAVPGLEPNRLEMSSLLFVSRIEEVSDSQRDASTTPAPLYVGRRLLYPSMGEPVDRSSVSELPFYFVLYGDTRSASLRAQLLNNGQLIADAPIAVEQSSGPRVQHVGRLPVAALPPGTYEFRIAVTNNGRELTRTAFFTLR